MPYLGIDLHLKQMTISLQNEAGDVILRRQISTRWPKLAGGVSRTTASSPGRHFWIVASAPL